MRDDHCDWGSSGMNDLLHSTIVTNSVHLKSNFLNYIT